MTEEYKRIFNIISSWKFIITFFLLIIISMGGYFILISPYDDHTMVIIQNDKYTEQHCILYIGAKFEHTIDTIQDCNVYDMHLNGYCHIHQKPTSEVPEWLKKMKDGKRLY